MAQVYSLKDSGIRDLANAEGIVVARDQARHQDIATTNRYLKGEALAGRVVVVGLVAGDGDVGAFLQVALRVQFGGRGADVGSFHGGRSLADDEFLAVHDVEACGKGAAGGSPDGRCRLRLPVA